MAQDCADNNRKMPMELKAERAEAMLNGGGGSGRRKISTHVLSAAERDPSDNSYDDCGGFDDFVTVGHSEYPQRSPTQASKNQDGVGSFESWNYVFQKLDRGVYSKDLADREDLLVKSLDLNSAGNLANGCVGSGGVGGVVGTAGAGSNVEKRRSHQAETTKSTRQISGGGGGGVGEKSRTVEKSGTAEKQRVGSGAGVGGGKTGGGTSGKVEKSILKSYNANVNGVGRGSSGGGAARKTKSSLKSSNTIANGSATFANDNNNLNSNGNAATAESTTSTGGGASAKRSTSATGTLRSSGGRLQAPVSTQVVVSSPNEWSCRFCTFLNPDTKRICEMCCRSKDFNIEASVSHAPTCV